MSGKDLYDQMITIGIKENDAFDSNDTFSVSFPNIFIDYFLDKMQTINTKWKDWNTVPLRLWQTQLNFVVFCTSSACGVSSKHLNDKKHSVVRSLYQFHVYYHVKKVLKRLQVPLPYESRFYAANNPFSFKLCKDYDVPHNPMRYHSEKFFGTHQHGGWSDYIGPDSIKCWVIENLRDLQMWGPTKYQKVSGLMHT